MKSPAQIRYTHALVAFMGVLLIASFVADGLLVTQQRRQMMREAERFAHRELKLMETFIRAALLARDYQRVEDFFQQWAQEDPNVARFRAVAANGFVFVDYERSTPASHPMPLEHAVAYQGEHVMTLELIRDVTRIEEDMERVRLQLVSASILFVVVLGGFLWVTVQRMALIPMRRIEEELQMHRYRLERRVQERTSKLSATNKQLQQEIEDRELAQDDLKRHAERLKTLRDIDQSILAARSPRQIAAGALHHLRTLIPCMRTSVSIFDLKTREAVLIAVDTASSTEYGPGTRFSLEGAPFLEQLQAGREYLIPDVSALDSQPDLLRGLVREGVRAVILVPLRSKETLIGALQLCSDQPGGCTGRTIDIAHEVGDLLAVAIEQGRLHEQVQQYAAELEQRVAQRTTELREANDELEAFAYSVSHDLRGHLWTVRGFAEFLVEKYADHLGEEGRDYAESILEASRAMEILIRDLLTYSRLNQGTLELHPVSLQRVVDESLEQLEERVRERGAEVRVEAPLAEAWGEHATLVQVVGNLIGNAVKFVPADTPPRVRVHSETYRNWVVLWIEDNGIGVPDADQERIFRVFERLHNPESYPGTGLGLAIVLRGMARLGGLVGLESKLGEGSRFWVALPRLSMPAEALPAAAHQDQGPG